MNEENKRVIVISQYSFPNGMAATNRILAYTKGLVDNGIGVDIVIPFMTDYVKDLDNNCLPNEGIYKGISYYYSVRRYKFKNILFRAFFSQTKLNFLVGFYTSFQLLKKLFKKNKYLAIIISSDTISILKWYSFLAHFFGVKSVFIFDEYPIPIRHKLKKKIPLYKEYLYRSVLKSIDAYISISENLKKYFCNFVERPTFVLPIIVDVDKFSLLPDNKNKHLSYVGNMELTKDNVDIIIEAFSLIHAEYPGYTLNFYGSPNVENEKYLKNLVEKLNLQDKVFFHGKIDSLLVPKVLVNSHILVSSQPNTLRAAGGFPTKLGEYLATGVPALFTNVGENASYVEDGKHVFFAKPNDVKDYADKLRFILDNYDKACAVAKEGQKFVKENYSSYAQGKKLKKFLNQI